MPNKTRGLRKSAYFMNVLHFLLEAGLPLHEAIEAGCLEGDEIDEEGARPAFFRISEGIRKGEAFSTSLRKAGMGLTEAQYAIIAAGERAGNAGKSVEAVKEMLEADLRARERTMAALSYPIAVTSVAILGSIVVAALMASGAFGFGGTGKAAGPLMNSLAAVGALLGTVIVLASLFAFALRSGGASARKAEAIMRRIPIIGKASVVGEIGRYCLIVRTLCDANAPLLEALRMARGSLRSHSMREAAEEAVSRIERGAPASTAFKATAGMPRRVSQWIGFAERTGSPEKAFGYLQKHYLTQAQNLREKGLALVEPLSILGAGIIMLIVLSGLVMSLLASTYGALNVF